MAWEHLRGAEATTMIHDVGRDPAAAGAAAALARQVVYLYGSLVTRTTMQWADAGAALIRALANRNVTKHLGDIHPHPGTADDDEH
eukprot:4792679-Heterocapsa_arctica.AAC.1